ncbi:MAG: histone deacetylase family protein, partial [Thermoanaerobaculia bacterium]
MLSIYTNPVFYQHDTGAGHPETATRIDAALTGVERAGFAASVSRETVDHPDTDRIIAKVHSADYERALEQAARSGMCDFLSGDNPMSSQTFAAARTAVGAALTAADEMMRGEGNRAFVIARPPGHHAERLQPMGFCFFNTIACVADWLREQNGIERVFVFDFDVHHGN